MNKIRIINIIGTILGAVIYVTLAHYTNVWPYPIIPNIIITSLFVTLYGLFLWPKGVISTYLLLTLYLTLPIISGLLTIICPCVSLWWIIPVIMGFIGVLKCNSYAKYLDLNPTTILILLYIDFGVVMLFAWFINKYILPLLHY